MKLIKIAAKESNYRCILLLPCSTKWLSQTTVYPRLYIVTYEFKVIIYPVQLACGI